MTGEQAKYNAEKALVPVQQRDVEFYGDQITAVQLDDGSIYVPIRPICDFLGVSWPSQRNRIDRDPVLGEEAVAVRIMTPGGRQETICLPLPFIRLMLASIDPRRIRVNGELLNYCCRDLYHVLTAAFEDKPQTRVERMRLLKAALASTDDEREIEPLIAELALVSGLSIIPRIRVANPQEEVYLARAEDGLCKIGVSRATESRIRAINRNRPDDVSLLHAFPADDALEAERKLHARYQNKQVWGEWFKLGPDDILTIRGYTAYHTGQFIGGSA